MPGYKVKVETHTIGSSDYHIRSLLDRQQYSDPDGAAAQANIAPAMWPVFGVVWPAGLFLAEAMDTFPQQGKRILEIGCGIGLASLVLHRRGADITSTDLHPLTEDFMQQNLALNDMAPLPFYFGSWEETDLALERFDLIIGSDLLYEADHPALLATFIERHACDRAEVIIVDAGRGHHGRFNREMVALGYSKESDWSDQQNIRNTLKKGHVMNFRRRMGSSGTA
jgi:predicted nicotinamide N-methyase